ncbi:MAG: hypothetical protein GC178_09335 [Flavobacteriales bacterium]|nr:hypothetical protein [Flavobacteriales bacterium]
MAYHIQIYRIPELNGSAMAFRIFVDGEETARIKSIDETIDLELEDGTHFIQVKMWPDYYRSTPIQVDSRIAAANPILFAGFTGKLGFSSLRRDELKLLPENEFKEVVKPAKPWPKLSSMNMALVTLVSLLIGGYIVFVSQSTAQNEDNSFLALLLGVGTAIGGVSAFYFNRSKTNSKFAYNKPLFDAISLLILPMLLSISAMEWYISVGLTVIGVCLWFYLISVKNKRMVI